jgi:hypothetical protein
LPSKINIAISVSLSDKTENLFAKKIVFIVFFLM